MFVKAVALCNFRNYEQLVFTPSEGKNLICGDNAQGKTNLLEAIHLCAFGRSQRTVHDEDMIRMGADSAIVKVRVCSAIGGEHTISITLGEQKRIETDKVRIQRLADLMGALKVVMFSPESLSLVKGAPQERRRFMDMCISQLSRTYFYKLQQYNTALRQRNALLKSPNASSSRDYIRMWDEQLTRAGAYIMSARERFMGMLAPKASLMHEKLSRGRDELSVTYSPSLKAQGLDTAQVQEMFSERLYETFDDDLRRGATGTGIHKDDMAVRINGEDARSFASQGQQRTAALSMRLSEIDFIHDVSDEYPVVLLDDVFSELDDERCLSLIECMTDCQCIFTAAASQSLDITGAKVFRCVSGTISDYDG